MFFDFTFSVKFYKLVLMNFVSRRLFAFLSTYLLFINIAIADDIVYRLSYQRDIFEKSYKPQLIRFHKSGEIESVFGGDIILNGDKEILDFIRRYDSLFGASRDECKFEITGQMGIEGLRIVRAQKFCSGYPVEAEVITFSLSKNSVFSIRSNSKDFKRLDLLFLISERDIPHIILKNSRSLEIKGIKRVLYRIGDSILPVYKVDVLANNLLIGYRYFINAKTGKILYRLPTLKSAKGYVYLDSPEKSVNPVFVELPQSTEPSVLKNEIVDVYSNCNPDGGCNSSSRLAIANSSGDYPYLPNESSDRDPFAEVMTYYQINRLYNWFSGSGLSFNPFSIIAAVNYVGSGSEYDEMFQCNGFYNNHYIVVGYCPAGNQANQSGVSINISYDADVLMHEMTHGFFDEIYELDPVIDGLGFTGMVMGLNEAIADFVPSHITDDALIGRHMGKIIKKSYLRDLNSLRKCPEYLDGEFHNDGEIISTALWGARGLVPDRELFAKMVLLSIGSLNRSATFEDVYEQVVAFTARSFSNSVAENIRKPFLDRGLNRCGRFIELPNGYQAKGYLYPALDLGEGGEIPFEVQFVYEIPSGIDLLNVDITAANYSGSTNTDYIKFYVNLNRPIDYSFEGVKSDFVWVRRQNVIDNPPPGKYYILPVGDGQGLYYFTIQFTYREPAPVVNSVDPDEVRLESIVDEFNINGQNFKPEAKIRLPAGITYDDYEVVDSNNIKVYNMRVGRDAYCGYNSVSVINPDGQRGMGKSLLLIVKGNDKCKCDFSLECDEGCKCDPDCDTGGCGCSYLR